VLLFDEHEIHLVGGGVSLLGICKKTVVWEGERSD
jgi:hypothetical protein